MNKYRIEEDCLGQVQVGADKYWKSQTQRSIENFKNELSLICCPIFSSMV